MISAPTRNLSRNMKVIWHSIGWDCRLYSHFSKHSSGKLRSGREGVISLLYPSLFISKKSLAQCSVETVGSVTWAVSDWSHTWYPVLALTSQSPLCPPPTIMKLKIFQIILTSLHCRYLYFLRKTPLHSLANFPAIELFLQWRREGVRSDILTSPKRLRLEIEWAV